MTRFYLPSALLSLVVALEAQAGAMQPKPQQIQNQSTAQNNQNSQAGNTQTPATSQRETPILVKKSAAGFVPPEWKKEETCEVYTDRIVIRREFGMKSTITSEEIRPSSLSGDYQSPLQAAAAGKITEESMMVIDGPSYEYLGYVTQDGAMKEVILKAENGMNASMLINSSIETQLLMNVLDSVCPSAFQ